MQRSRTDDYVDWVMRSAWKTPEKRHCMGSTIKDKGFVWKETEPTDTTREDRSRETEEHEEMTARYAI